VDKYWGIKEKNSIKEFLKYLENIDEQYQKAIPNRATPLEELAYLQHSDRWYAIYDFISGVKYPLKKVIDSEDNDFAKREKQLTEAIKNILNVKRELQKMIA
ncbi:MAG: hypothetical protein AAF598_17495, partial [Bacteroidota bacterium]